MKDLVFVSVAFGELYVKQQDRLRESILKLYPAANLLFYRDVLPTGSPAFLDSLYGFKTHAIKNARAQGYDRVVWFDPAMILVDMIEPALVDQEFIAVKDDNLLATFISDEYLKLNHMTRDRLRESAWHLVGGSFYYFDFNSAAADSIFSAWHQDEICGRFGSQEQEARGQLNGHRADESCMSMRMYQNSIGPVDAVDVKYCIAENPIFIKKHFK